MQDFIFKLKIVTKQDLTKIILTTSDSIFLRVIPVKLLLEKLKLMHKYTRPLTPHLLCFNCMAKHFAEVILCI